MTIEEIRERYSGNDLDNQCAQDVLFLLSEIYRLETEIVNRTRNYIELRKDNCVLFDEIVRLKKLSGN